MTKKDNSTVSVELVSGVSGPALYVDDYRVWGPKPWGGGTTTQTCSVPRSELLKALKINSKSKR